MFLLTQEKMVVNRFSGTFKSLITNLWGGGLLSDDEGPR